MKRILAFFALGCSLVFATEEEDIDNRVESINARKGFEVSGAVRSASFNSFFESPQEKPSETTGYFTNRMPSHEISEFVQLDLDFKFRPYDIISANLKLRLSAGMQEYFAKAATTVNAPWLNVEGNLGNSFYWVVGSFRQSYSPLTLYMPGIDVMYEPTVFARKREVAQKEALLDGNQRNLQGFNLQFRPQLGETWGELRVEALGARLRRAGYLDASGAMGNMLPNEGIIGATQAGRYDKFLLAGNVELLPLNKNLLVGVTYLSIFDDEETSANYSNYSVNPEITLDSFPQSTSVFAGRLGADIAGIIKSNSIVANLVGEFAMSNDKVYTDSVNSKQESGNAILAQLDLGYKSDISVTLSNSFVRNDSAWFNNVAQSPSFFARRVLNSDKDVGCASTFCDDPTLDKSFNLSKYGVYSPLYSTFDAMYFFTPKHSPMIANLQAGAPDKPQTQTQSYNIGPYTKNSWGSSILTRAELALLEKLSDINLQMALPNGFATSNRQGFQEVLTANWKGLAEVKGLFASYEQLLPDYTAKTAKYTEFGGGAKIDILGLLGFEQNPLEISGSYKKSAKEQEWDAYGNAEYTSDFRNAGLYYRFYKRFGLTFGFQRIESELNVAGRDVQKAQTAGLKVDIVPILRSRQYQWMTGLDYTVAKNAWLSINYGIMDVKNTYDLNGFVNSVGEIDKGTNLPGYIVVNGAAGKEIEHEFSRSIIEAIINVEF
jgi:hypothetical protein